MGSTGAIIVAVGGGAVTEVTCVGAFAWTSSRSRWDAHHIQCSATKSVHNGFVAAVHVVAWKAIADHARAAKTLIAIAIPFWLSDDMVLSAITMAATQAAMPTAPAQ